MRQAARPGCPAGAKCGFCGCASGPLEGVSSRAAVLHLFNEAAERPLQDDIGFLEVPESFLVISGSFLGASVVKRSG